MQLPIDGGLGLQAEPELGRHQPRVHITAVSGPGKTSMLAGRRSHWIARISRGARDTGNNRLDDAMLQ